MRDRERQANNRAAALHEQLIDFTEQLEEFESEIKNISSHEHVRSVISSQVSNKVLVQYKRRLEALENTWQELTKIRDEMNAAPGYTKLESFVYDAFREIDERLMAAEDTLYDDQALSNKNRDEIRSNRDMSQSAPNFPELQLESNKYSDEVHKERVKQADEKRSESQVNSSSFFKKTALIAGTVLVAVGVLRVLGR